MDQNSLLTNFKLLPEIYQIEVTNACNLQCPLCPRFVKRRPSSFINPNLIQLMADRGDLDNSYFIELQFAGEPLLHPNLMTIVNTLKKKNLLVGLSTNGTLIHEKIDELLLLDAITISVDSFEKESYEKIRVGSSYNRFISNIKFLLENRGSNPFPIIDLQLIRSTEPIDAFWSKQWMLGEKFIKENNYNVNLRSVPECYGTWRSYKPSFFRDKIFPTVQNNDLCLNPFTSVSIQADGNVTSCCFSFGTDNGYGNVKDAPLSEIWQKSSALKELRKAHAMQAVEGTFKLNLARGIKSKGYKNFCRHCINKSPMLFHWKLINESIVPKLKEACSKKVLLGDWKQNSSNNDSFDYFGIK